ncbi:MAG: aspartate/glutamate racemase family protein, partial [Thermoguttaceae bacterium]|nr:aspartate/glutamate racemase family protein [Thermoguttaceae bacterium]
CELLTNHTLATCDADHIDMLVSSRATTPDRTAYILDKSSPDPLPVMLAEAHRLENAGVDLIVVPCNTAHYFYDGLQKGCKTPILNIIDETTAHLSRIGTKTFGLLATDGTIRSGAYERFCAPRNLTCITPTNEEQAVILDMIYGQIKQNKPVDMAAFYQVVLALVSRGCERIVLGCTELSLLKKSGLDEELFVDSSGVVLAQHVGDGREAAEIRRYFVAQKRFDAGQNRFDFLLALRRALPRLLFGGRDPAFVLLFSMFFPKTLQFLLRRGVLRRVRPSLETRNASDAVIDDQIPVPVMELAVMTHNFRRPRPTLLVVFLLRKPKRLQSLRD